MIMYIILVRFKQPTKMVDQESKSSQLLKTLDLSFPSPAWAFHLQAFGSAVV